MTSLLVADMYSHYWIKFAAFWTVQVLYG